MFLFFLDVENEEKLLRNVNVIIKIKMENYSLLINLIPHQLKILIRSLERCIKKVNNANWSIVYIKLYILNIFYFNFNRNLKNICL